MHDDLSLIPSAQINEYVPIILIASDTRRPQRTGDMAYCDGFVGSPPVLCSVALLSLVDQTWRPLSGLFASCSINCDVLIG